MRILGHERVVVPTAQLTIGRAENGDDLTLKFRAPSLTAMAEVETGIVSPEAPPGKEVERDLRGNVIKNGDGVPKLKRNHEDPGHLIALRDTRYATMVATIVACLEPGQLKFEVKRKDYKGDREYYLAVLAEMEEGGITMAIITRLEAVVAPLLSLSQAETVSAQEVLGVPEAGETEGQASPTSP